MTAKLVKKTVLHKASGTPTAKVTLTNGTVKVTSVEKTGGNVNYYLVDIKDPKRLEPYKAECEDIIEAMQMTFAEGNVFKSLWRSCAARSFGTLKEGQDLEGVYDAEKMVYYSQRALAQRKRLKGI